MLSILDINITCSIFILVATAVALLFVKSGDHNLSYNIATLGVFVTLASMAIPEPMINILVPDLITQSTLIRGVPIFETILLTLLVLLGFKDAVKNEGVKNYSEYYALIIFSLIGCLTLLSSNNLIVMYVGIEVISICGYGLTSFNLKSLSSEAGIKYFVLGSIASAILLLGMALIYGATGSLEFSTILSTPSGILRIIGGSLVIVALLFKTGFFPFHWWVPDVYTAAASSVVAFMSSVIKLAFIFILFKFCSLYTVIDNQRLIWLVAFLSIIFGNLLALKQRDFKRILAYASISQVGYVLMLLTNSGSSSLSYIASFYIAIYGLSSIAALAIISDISKSESADISNFQGLLKTNPFAGLILSFSLLSFAGLPPAIGGFIAKFAVFSTALSQGVFGIALIALLSAAVACFYYLRLITLICFMPAGNNNSEVNLVVPITCSVLTVLLGFYILAGI